MPLVVYFDGRKLSPTVLMFRFVCLLIYLFICLFVYVYNTAQRVTNRSVCVCVITQTTQRVERNKTRQHNNDIT